MNKSDLPIPKSSLKKIINNNSEKIKKAFLLTSILIQLFKVYKKWINKMNINNLVVPFTTINQIMIETF